MLIDEKSSSIKKQYELIQEKLSLISNKDKTLFQQTFDKLHGKINKSVIQQFIKKPKDNYERLEQLFKNVSYEDVINCVGPLFAIFGTFKLYQHFTTIPSDIDKSDPDTIILFKLVGISIVISILMSIVETYYIKWDIKDKESTFFKLAQLAKENWKRYWETFKQGRFSDLIKDMISSTIAMGYETLKWQISIGKSDDGYAVLFTANWIANAGIFYYFVKSIGNYFASDSN